VTDFDYSQLNLDVDHPIYRTKCLAVDAPGTLPDRCHEAHGHVGPHRARDWQGNVFKEWADEDNL